MNSNLTVDHQALAAFCRRWNIEQLALFGSVLRADFRPNSDVDVLVSFQPNADWGLFEHVHMQDELSDLFGRKVDLVTRRSVEASENWIRRKAILSSAECLYAA